MRALRAAFRREDAQSMVEVGLVLPFLFLMVAGIIDFGMAFSARVALNNAARNGARYAATHPTSWSNAASPASTTIQGQIIAAEGGARLTNDDSHITISYLTTTGTTCGSYSASSGSFSANTGYTQATCVVPDNTVQVQLTYHYTPITPGLSKLVSGGFTFTTTAEELEEQ